jgi:enoyl-CoA hydratase
MDLRAFSESRDRPAGTQREAGERTDAPASAFDFKDISTKPVIAAVNGAAVGGGFEMVLGCDLVVAAAHARFGLPEVKRGLMAGGGGTLLGTRLPLALALEVALTGELIDAPRAAEWGLVNRIVPAEALLEASLALAATIAANGPLAIRTTKQLVRRAVLDDPKRGWATPEELTGVFGSEDAKEGAMAFLEKRPPVWKGR